MEASRFTLFQNCALGQTEAPPTSDRNSEVTPYIDIKSEGLRDILREALHDIKSISLMEDKSSVIKISITSKKIANLDLDRAKRPFPFPP